MDTAMHRWLKRPVVVAIMAGTALLGFFLSAALMPRLDATARAGVALDRGQAIELAHHQAELLGLETLGWRAMVYPQTEEGLRRLLHEHPGAEADEVGGLHPFLMVYVILIEPGSEDALCVWLTKDGDVVGFDRPLVTPPEGDDVATTPETATELANAAFARRLAPQLLHRFRPVQDEAAEESAVVRFKREWQPATLEGLTLRAEVHVMGDQLVKDTITVEGETVSAQRLERSIMVMSLLVWLIFLPIIAYSVIRFVVRWREQEVPLARCVIIAVLFLLLSSGATILFMSDFAFALMQQSSQLPLKVALAAGPAMFVLQALLGSVLVAFFLAVMWGGFEGDLREAYPGRLTSFDAVLAGRIGARNVGLSVVVGALFAGWMLLARTVVLLPWLGDAGAGGTLVTSLAFVGARWPLGIVLIKPLTSALQTLFAVLIPLPLLLRWTRSPTKALWLGVGGVTAVAAFLIAKGGIITPLPAAMAVAGVTAAMFILPFAAFDLLAVVAGSYLALIWVLAWQLVGQPAASLHHAGIGAMMCAAGLLLVGALLARRGSVVTAEEVRPAYAGNIAERLSLKAEVSMGAEARARMLPRAAPEVAGARIHFTPGESEQQDGYCDFFPLADGRLGLTLAALGREGSVAALVMTLLKGYIRNYSRRMGSPSQVLERVASRLSADLDPDRPISLFYGVYDPRDRTIVFSRLGDGLQVLCWGAGMAGAPSHVAQETGGHNDVQELTLAFGETLVVTTVAGQRQHSQSELEDAVYRLMTGEAEGSDRPMMVLAVQEVAS